MAAHAAAPKSSDVVFTPGELQVIALKYPAGKTIDAPFGLRVMFTCVDDRRFFLDPDPASDVERALAALGIGAGQPFRLTKFRQPKGGHRWVVEPANGSHTQNHVPTALETKLTRSVEMARNGEPFPPPAVVAGTGSQPISPTASRLMGAFLSAIDAISEAQAYASRKGLKITFTAEDIRCCAISAYINTCREGR